MFGSRRSLPIFSVYAEHAPNPGFGSRDILPCRPLDIYNLDGLHRRTPWRKCEELNFFGASDEVCGWSCPLPFLTEHPFPDVICLVAAL